MDDKHENQVQATGNDRSGGKSGNPDQQDQGGRTEKDRKEETRSNPGRQGTGSSSDQNQDDENGKVSKQDR